MAVYLSREWIAEANEALAALDPSADAGSIGYRIEESAIDKSVVNFTKADRTTVNYTAVDYTLVLGPDRCGMDAGVNDADVVLILGYATAAGIAKHQLSAQREFLNGSMRIDGNVNVLMTSSEQASKAASLLAELETEFPDV